MKVLVTGASGYLGSAVVAELKSRQIPYAPAPSSSLCDLLKPGHVDDLFQQAHPTHLIHCAAPYRGGGIGYTQHHAYTMASEMIRMDALLIDKAIRAGVQKFVGIGTLHEYPEISGAPIAEDQLWEGAPEPVNGTYGIAKRMQLALLQAARQEHGLHGIHLILSNLYGPGCKFNAHEHVIPATICKIANAQEEEIDHITIWGDGSTRREFLYITDAARGVVEALLSYDDPMPLNLCSGNEIQICDLVQLIGIRMAWDGEVLWDPAKPTGQRRYLFSYARANTLLHWAPVVTLGEGLNQTIDAFRRGGTI